MKKIMFVFGTHPETIKMCSLVKVFKKPYAVFETTDRFKNLPMIP